MILTSRLKPDGHMIETEQLDEPCPAPLILVTGVGTKAPPHTPAPQASPHLATPVTIPQAFTPPRAPFTQEASITAKVAPHTPTPPAPSRPITLPITTNPTLAAGTDNVITDAAGGFGRVISYSIDGTGNNLARPNDSAAGADEIRLAPANFAKGTTNTPVDGPNARVISNTLMANDPGAVDPGGRSAFMYAFGQFLDHDMSRNPSQTGASAATLSITVPADDAVFTPGSSITITRAQTDPANGLAVNVVTSVLDLSQIYGSDAATAASLRNGDGTLVTSVGYNPPIVAGQFAGGDIRTAENPDLTAIDALFVREHNFWVAKLHAEQPNLSGDQLYDMARAINTAEYQSITYNEYLPTLLGKNALSAYTGYNPKVSTQIFEEFSTAAFRFGHTIISTTETKISNTGAIQEATDLIAAMGETTSQITANGGFDALLRNLGQDFSNKEGVQIASDLLDLFNPGAPGSNFDLGAVDVERTRDLGIATLNQTRVALGLSAYTDFSQITADTTLAAKLQSVYGTVDQIDLFVGGLAETPVTGSMVGQTFQTIMVDQFQNLRAGDRLYFENQGFTPQMMQQIEHTTMSDLILRDTDTQVMQSNAFIATARHASDATTPIDTMPQLVVGVDTDGAIISATAGVANTLVAGAGIDQTLIGGGSSDAFTFLGTGHIDIIQNFQAMVDVIDFENLTSQFTFADLYLRAGGHGDTIVTLGGNTIDVLGVAPKALHASNFLINATNPAMMPAGFGDGGSH